MTGPRNSTKCSMARDATSTAKLFWEAHWNWLIKKSELKKTHGQVRGVTALWQHWTKVQSPGRTSHWGWKVTQTRSPLHRVTVDAWFTRREGRENPDRRRGSFYRLEVRGVAQTSSSFILGRAQRSRTQDLEIIARMPIPSSSFTTC